MSDVMLRFANKRSENLSTFPCQPTEDGVAGCHDGAHGKAWFVDFWLTRQMWRVGGCGEYALVHRCGKIFFHGYHGSYHLVAICYRGVIGQLLVGAGICKESCHFFHVGGLFHHNCGAAFVGREDDDIIILF